MQKGFTLIELLVVISIIGLLSSVVVFGYKGWTDKARVSNVQQYAKSIVSYLGAYRGGGWNFETMAGNTVADISGFGQTATVSNGASAKGVLGKGINFTSGWSSYAYVSDSVYLSPTNAMTIGLWVKTAAIAGDGYLVYKYDSSPYPGFAVYYNAINYVALWAGGMGGGDWLFCAKNIADDKWHYIVATAQMGGMKKLYIDGKFCIENATGTAGLDSAQYFHFGYGLTGMMDDIDFFNEALATTAVEKLYLAGIATHQSVAFEPN